MPHEAVEINAPFPDQMPEEGIDHQGQLLPDEGLTVRKPLAAARRKSPMRFVDATGGVYSPDMTPGEATYEGYSPQQEEDQY